MIYKSFRSWESTKTCGANAQDILHACVANTNYRFVLIITITLCNVGQHKKTVVWVYQYGYTGLIRWPVSSFYTHCLPHKISICILLYTSARWIRPNSHVRFYEEVRICLYKHAENLVQDIWPWVVLGRKQKKFSSLPRS